MNCTEVSAILDAHRSARLSAAERAHVDAHLATCEDCDAAWRAHTELLALRVPLVPATLLERALLAARVPPVTQPRRAWRPIAFGITLLAGAALASVTIVSLTRSPSAGTPPSTDGEPSTLSEAPDGSGAPPGDFSAEAEPDDRPTSVELVEAALNIQPIVRRNPDYPPFALEQGLEGNVQLKFDVTAAGIVENVTVIESSDAQFEDPAARAVAEWRYLPRIVAGKRVGSNGIHTIIRFALSKEPAPVNLREIRPDNDYLAFNRALEVAMDRLAADDLRGVELQLDEMHALYGANRVDLWSFYGYLYTVEGNYARAIDAYETAVAVAMRSQRPTSGPYVPLANLYFARHQYDMALKTLLRPQQIVSGAPAGGSGLVSKEATALIERLRALGVTEETLIGR